MSDKQSFIEAENKASENFGKEFRQLASDLKKSGLYIPSSSELQFKFIFDELSSYFKKLFPTDNLQKLYPGAALDYEDEIAHLCEVYFFIESHISDKSDACVFRRLEKNDQELTYKAIFDNYPKQSTIFSRLFWLKDLYEYCWVLMQELENPNPPNFDDFIYSLQLAEIKGTNRGFASYKKEYYKKIKEIFGHQNICFEECRDLILVGSDGEISHNFNADLNSKKLCESGHCWELWIPDIFIFGGRYWVDKFLNLERKFWNKRADIQNEHGYFISNDRSAYQLQPCNDQRNHQLHGFKKLVDIRGLKKFERLGVPGVPKTVSFHELSGQKSTTLFNRQERARYLRKKRKEFGLTLKRCESCNQLFSPVREDAKFCCDKCRVYHNRKQRKNEEF